MKSILIIENDFHYEGLQTNLDDLIINGTTTYIEMITGLFIETFSDGIAKLLIQADENVIFSGSAEEVLCLAESLEIHTGEECFIIAPNSGEFDFANLLYDENEENQPIEVYSSMVNLDIHNFLIINFYNEFKEFLNHE